MVERGRGAGWLVHLGLPVAVVPASLLADNQQPRLADALYASSRYSGVELNFNKGLAGAPPDAIAGAKDTAMNPSVLTAFALAIAANAQGPAYPGVPGLEPSVAEARKAAERIERCMSQLRGTGCPAGILCEREQLLRKQMAAIVLGREPLTPS